MIVYAGLFINAGVVALGLITLGVKIGKTQGTVKQLDKRLDRIENVLNGTKVGE